MASSTAATAEEAGIVDDVDYGYEEHAPSPRSVADNYLILTSDKSLGAPPCRHGSLSSTEEENPQPCLEAVEASANSFCPTSNESLLSASIDHRNHRHGITFSHQQQKLQQEAPPSMQQSEAHVPQRRNYDESSYCSPPNSCHNKRRHNRRGGFVHGSLLRSAVLASMESPPDEDQPTPYRQNSAISLQSLQDALRETSSLASSPRKRARKVSRRRSDHVDLHEQRAQQEDNPELESMLNALRVQDPQAAALAAVRREPPMRRVSRKTSCDSRISDFSDWDEEEFWGSSCSSQDQQADESDSD